MHPNKQALLAASSAIEALNSYYKSVMDLYMSSPLNPRAQQAINIAEVIILAAHDVIAMASTAQTKANRAFRKKYTRKRNHFNQALCLKIWSRMMTARIQAALIASAPIAKREFNNSGIAIVGETPPEVIAIENRQVRLPDVGRHRSNT